MEQETLCAWALEAGFAQAGFCSTEGFEASFRQVQVQPALAERRQLRFFPKEELPWARSLAVLLWSYRPAALPEDSAYMAENGQLFLLVQGTDEVFLSVLSEFGERQSFSAAAELVLEHAAPLCPKNAVFKLAELIKKEQKPLHTPFRSEYSN